MALNSKNNSASRSDSPEVEELKTQVISQWQSLRKYLPADLDEMAKRHKAMAFQTHSQIGNASILVHLVCLWTIGSFSLRACAAFAKATGLASISHVAWRKRFIRMQSFLEAVLNHLLSDSGTTTQPRDELFSKWQVIAVDGTSVPSRWKSIRLHWALDLANNKIHQILFDPSRPNWGETFRNFSPQKAQVWVADRIYCTSVGLRHLVEAGAHAVVRYNRNLTVFADPEKQKELDPLQLAIPIRRGETKDLSVWVGTKKGAVIPARLVITRLSRAAQKEQIFQLYRSKIQVTGYTKKLAGYLIVLTTLEKDEMSGEEVLSLYRLRWQIELRFKRAKSLMGLSENRCENPETIAIWLLTHLIGQLLLDHVQRDALGEANESYRTSAYYIDQFGWELLRTLLFSIHTSHLWLFLKRFVAALTLPKSCKKPRTHERFRQMCERRSEPLWNAA